MNSSELRRLPDCACPKTAGIATRSSYYYERSGTASEENPELMRLIDEIYLADPENHKLLSGIRLQIKILGVTLHPIYRD